MVDDLSAEEVVARWDLYAEQYAAATHKYGDINKEVVLTPAILNMLGEVRGKRILDAGCGEGFLSRLMAERGAKVTAVDYSKKLLEIAEERTPERSSVEYMYANLEQLEGLSRDTFDLVVSNVVIQDVPDYQAALRELFRVLRPGGSCILAMTHPCFSSDGAWVRDGEGTKQYWKIDNYFRERGYEINWPQEADKRVINYHRTLTSYFKAITRAGFSIEDLEEPFPSPEAIQKHPHFVDDLRMCHFLVLRLGKPGVG